MIGLNPKNFVDTKLSMLLRRPVFDLDKFEDFLEMRWGEDTRNMSIQEIVDRHYPQYAEQIRKVFCMEE